MCTYQCEACHVEYDDDTPCNQCGDPGRCPECGHCGHCGDPFATNPCRRDPETVTTPEGTVIWLPGLPPSRPEDDVRIYPDDVG